MSRTVSISKEKEMRFDFISVDQQVAAMQQTGGTSVSGGLGVKNITHKGSIRLNVCDEGCLVVQELKKRLWCRGTFGLESP